MNESQGIDDECNARLFIADDHGYGQWEHDHGSEDIQCPWNADDHEYSDCAFCHSDKQPQACGTCGKTYYYAEGHARHCTEGSSARAEARGTSALEPTSLPRILRPAVTRSMPTMRPTRAR